MKNLLFVGGVHGKKDVHKREKGFNDTLRWG
jgi:hypothetical protein